MIEPYVMKALECFAIGIGELCIRSSVASRVEDGGFGT